MMAAAPLAPPRRARLPRRRTLGLLLAALLAAGPAATHAVQLEGLEALDDLSGATFADGRLLVVDDETDALFVLREAAPDHFALEQRVALPSGEKEMDLEGVAVAAGRVFLAGSHAWVRKAVEPKRTRAQNRAELAKVRARPDRDQVLALPWRPDQTPPVGEPARWTLRPQLDADPYVGPHAQAPGKENGINIEGVAATADGTLAFGFRSPVLRGQLVPVLLTRWLGPGYELRFLRLGGAGVRDLVALPEGFLVLSGPPAETREPQVLWLWDGEDEVPHEGDPEPAPVPLAMVPANDRGTAEAIAVLGREERTLRVLVLYDGVPGGAPELIRVTLP